MLVLARETKAEAVQTECRLATLTDGHLARHVHPSSRDLPGSYGARDILVPERLSQKKNGLKLLEPLLVIAGQSRFLVRNIQRNTGDEFRQVHFRIKGKYLSHMFYELGNRIRSPGVKIDRLNHTRSSNISASPACVCHIR